MAFLLTWHGTLLCLRRPNGVAVHCPLTSSFDDVAPVTVDLPAKQLQFDLVHHLLAELPELPPNPPGALESFAIAWSEDQRTLQFRRDGATLYAEGDSDRITLFEQEGRGWDTFLPLEPNDFEVLRQILRTSWLLRSSGALIGQPTMGDQFRLLFGDFPADLRYQMPLDLSQWPHRLTVLRDGWRIDQVCQYRPLVYYAALGNDAVIEQFVLSVDSLFRHGRYDGDIAVLTDRAPDDLARLIPAEQMARLTVIPCDASDRTGFLSARYQILEWQDAWRYQPILYVDTDIVFDIEVAPMLHAIAMSDRIAAPLEIAAPLASSPSVGATLLQSDACSPRFAAGFNSGTLGIPNLTTHAGTLRLIRRIVANHAALHGRTALPWGDQEIANYVSYKIGNFDTGLISRYVRFGDGGIDPLRRSGLVHFCPVSGGAQAKANAMREYMRALAAPG